MKIEQSPGAEKLCYRQTKFGIIKVASNSRPHLIVFSEGNLADVYGQHTHTRQTHARMVAVKGFECVKGHFERPWANFLLTTSQLTHAPCVSLIIKRREGCFKITSGPSEGLASAHCPFKSFPRRGDSISGRICTTGGPARR